MSLARLRAVLQSTYQVSLESTPALALRLNRITQYRNRVATEGGGTTVPTKEATAIDIRGARDWSIRPIDLLHKIGNLTTPADANLAALSASWATRRYFWSIAEPNGIGTNFHLSADARGLDFHQKTLLSDEFGIGFAGLLLEDRFEAGQFVDISKALQDPQTYQEIQQMGRTQPDFLIWGDAPDSPYYVVECKGSQSSKTYSIGQLHRGLEQVPSIVFGAGARQVTSLVVATYLGEKSTKVQVIDPPPDPPDFEDSEDLKSERVSERIGKRKWRIPSAERFEARVWLAQESALLKWAGQYRQAAQLDEELEPGLGQPREIPQSAELERQHTEFGVFVGMRTSSFPELGSNRVQIFTGIEEQLFASLAERGPHTREIALRNQRRFHQDREQVRERSPYTSISQNGTCMIVEGL
jgi:hypothetical protein